MTRRPPFFMGPSLKRAVTIELNVIFGKWATAYRSEVVELLDPPALLDALREAFAAYSTDRSVDAMQVPVPLPAGQVPPGASGMLLAPGVVPGIPAYSVKVHAKFPGSDPAIRGSWCFTTSLPASRWRSWRAAI